MSFILLFVCGILGGVLGGMGLGGGTALIPLLTLVCGVVQSEAQGVNLLSFLPMAAIALSVHAKNGLLDLRGLAYIVLPALALSVPAAFLAVNLPSEALGKVFGTFLIVLSLFWFKNAFTSPKNRQQ